MICPRGRRARLTSLLVSVALSTLTLGAADVVVSVDPANLSSFQINRQLFGSFYEEHWGDISPAIFEQYLVNPSFEPWLFKDDDYKTRLVFEPPFFDNVAYPWEPYPGGAATLALSDDRFNSDRSQLIASTPGESGGIVQYLALPDYRVTRYRLRLYLKLLAGVPTLRAVFLSGPSGTAILDSQTLHATADWAPVEVELDLWGRLPRRHIQRFGIVRLGILVEGEGTILVDQATLYPVDAVDGVLNPETLENVREFGPTAIRWPGGNFASGYHWRDGIGPVEQRPTRANRAWGGVDPNHVGTDEWLQFARRMGLDPVMTIGFGEVSPEEAADWVEYCNGSIATRMGALRAEHGHAEPYGVTYWGIGNETYGTYQIGYSSARDYAEGLNQMARAMRERDPSIKIIGVGYGVHDDYRRPTNSWNRTVLTYAGGSIDQLDVHSYVYGPETDIVNAYGAPAVQRALLGSSQRTATYYNKLKDLLNQRDETRHIALVHHEWGVLPRSSALGAQRQSFLNLLATAEQYHGFFRNADFVQGAMLHNFSYFINPVRGHAEPPNPRSYVSRLYRRFAGGHLASLTAESGPLYSVEQDYPEIGPLRDVPEIDAVAIVTGDGVLHVCLLNRSLESGFEVRLQIAGAANFSSEVDVTRFESGTPSQQLTWQNPRPGFDTIEETAWIGGEAMHIVAPRHSLTYLRIAPASAPAAEAAPEGEAASPFFQGVSRGGFASGSAIQIKRSLK